MLRTIRARVDHQAEQRPDATYLVAPEPGLTMSFGELRDASRRLAAYLESEGIRPGAKVALLMHNGYQTCRLFIGAMYGGYCVTPLNLLAQPTQLSLRARAQRRGNRLRRARPGRAPATGGIRHGAAAAHGGVRGRRRRIPAARR
jgi:acyl-CoA synthetase (AMP-forming)/AMP-acid ligase II